MSKSLKAPFPYFGGKSRVADVVWERFGDVRNYVEPFAGSCAVLLGRPTPFDGVETVNDADGLLSNFWRALKHEPEAVAEHADWPVNEADLHARHLWLVGRRESLTERLMADPDWYDVKAAGWWVWGACAWIGKGWGGKLYRQLPDLGGSGRGIHSATTDPHELLNGLSRRLRSVRVACGDWSRVLGDSVTWRRGLTGIFLDPPYADGDIDYNAGDRTVYQDVMAWALENGDNPRLRIAVCGYEGDHDALEDAGWDVYAWKARGGYGSQGDGEGRKNASRERIWFSPHCLSERQPTLFGEVG